METKFQQRVPQKTKTDRPNLTGIPTQMKLDFEQRSGMSFDDVRVHYNSEKPAQFHALAYTRGDQIYIGPGQERSLSHELGHVIQQKAGRVRPTRWICGQPVNDQPELEREADRAPIQCMAAATSRDVNQMDITVPAMSKQKGANCGYHALARAICSFQDLSDKQKSNLEIELTTCAINNGYSVIGEAFDPYVLAQVGNKYCETNDIKIGFTVIPFCKDSLDYILSRLQSGKSVFLVPYFTTQRDHWQPIRNGQAENAHWCVIGKGDVDGQVKLYEGNKYGSGEFDGNRIHSPSDPLGVELATLLDSNESIQPQFHWDNFWENPPNCPNPSQEDKDVWLSFIDSAEAAVNSEHKDLTLKDLNARVEKVMSSGFEEVSKLPTYSNQGDLSKHIQNVHLNGYAIEVTRLETA